LLLCDGGYWLNNAYLPVDDEMKRIALSYTKLYTRIDIINISPGKGEAVINRLDGKKKNWLACTGIAGEYRMICEDYHT
jgi:hypothetical protein